ncbi:MAG TPA: nucleotidyltransferase, partial [Euryarchaeota archaeon]|nr:nucleotidyltransferase [Euryarchaeota archaeon]
MRVKVSKIGEEREVIYQEERWEILASLRELAREVMSSLMEFGIDSMAHGSIARGDVHRRSDVDVFIP